MKHPVGLLIGALILLVAGGACGILVMLPWGEEAREMRMAPTPAAASRAEVAEGALPARDPRPARRERGESTRPAKAPVEPAPEFATAFGTVRDLRGLPVEGARVYLPGRKGHWKKMRTRTNAAGRFELRGLPFSKVRIHAISEGDGRTSAKLSPTRAEPRVELDLELDPERRLHVGWITTKGESLEAVAMKRSPWAWSGRLDILVTETQPGETPDDARRVAQTREPTKAERERDPVSLPGYCRRVTLPDSSPVWVSLVAAGVVLESKLVQEPVREVLFVVEPGELWALESGLTAEVVSAEDGRRLEGVAIIQEHPIALGKTHPFSRDTPLQIAGRARGDYWLILQSEGHADSWRRVRLEAGETLDLGEVPMHRPVELRGRARDETGKSLRGTLTVAHHDPTTGESIQLNHQLKKAGAGGTFHIRGLEPGQYQLTFFGPKPKGGNEQQRVSLPTLIDATHGSRRGIELTAGPSVPVALVLPGGSGDGFRIQVVDERGLSPYDFQSDQSKREKRLSLHLLRGPYAVVVTKDGVELERHDFFVDESELTIELDLD